MKTKRIIIVLLLITICIPLSACQKDDYGSSAGENSSGEIATITIESYTKYLKFIAKNDMPDDFIYYDSLKEYGNFHSFVYAKIGNEYIYTFVDSEEFEVSLKIEPVESPQANISYVALTEFNSGDLRTVNIEESARIVRSGYEYRYRSGKLLSIMWEKNGKRFVLSGNGKFASYPVTTDTAVGKLLFNLNSDVVVQ